MGAALCSGASPLDSQLTTEIQDTVDQSLISVPASYMAERNRIIEKMREAAPGPYENLKYADYPDKNGSNVNLLACKNVTSDEAKKVIAKKVNEQIEPKVEAKTADYNPVARAALRKAVEKTVDELVNKAIDQFVQNINSNDKQAKP